MTISENEPVFSSRLIAKSSLRIAMSRSAILRRDVVLRSSFKSFCLAPFTF